MSDLNKQDPDASNVSVNLNVNLPTASRALVAETEPPYSTGLGYGLWCTAFAGVCGIHRFYLGKVGTGILWLLTFGLFGVGQFIDLIRMKSLVRDANIRDGRVPHPNLLAQAVGSAAPEKRRRGKKKRRQDLLHELLQAAVGNGGELTVTQGVLATGKTFEQVEEVLVGMANKGYVDVDNAPGTGVVVYRFPDLIGSGGSGSGSNP